MPVTRIRMVWGIIRTILLLLSVHCVDGFVIGTTGGGSSIGCIPATTTIGSSSPIHNHQRQTRHSYASSHGEHPNENTTLFITQLAFHGKTEAKKKSEDESDNNSEDSYYYYRLDPPVLLEEEEEEYEQNDNDEEEPPPSNYYWKHFNHHHEMATSKTTSTTTAWLESATTQIINIPKTTRLTRSDLERIDTLIAMWSSSSSSSNHHHHPESSITAAKTVETLLKRIVDEMHAGSKMAQITTQHYIHAIVAWGRATTTTTTTAYSTNNTTNHQNHYSSFASHRAMSIHEHMIQTYQITRNSNIRPNRASFHAVLRCIRDPHMAERIFWQDMPNVHVKPNVHTCTMLLEIYAKAIAATTTTNTAIASSIDDNNNTTTTTPKQSIEHWIRRAESLFACMPTTTLRIRRNPHTFLALQTVYAKARRVQSCWAVVEYMQTELYQNRGDVFAKPTGSHYNAVLQALMAPPNNNNNNYHHHNNNKHGNTNNYYISYADAKFAHEFLTRMETPVEQGGYDVEPDRLSYAMTILICARACQQATTTTTTTTHLSNELNSSHPENNHHPTTTTMTRSEILQCAQWAEINLERLERRAAAEIEKRHRIANHAAPPGVTMDVEMFNPCLTCLSRIARIDPTAPRRILQILHRMQKQHSHNHNIAAVQPNIRSWNAALNAFARASGTHHDRGYARKAEGILHHLWKLHKQGVPNVKPDAFAYAGVLTAFQRSNDADAAQRADALVLEMEELFAAGELQAPPDTYHYTILCGTWAKSGQSIAPERALQILVKMMERANAGHIDVKPNTRTYNAVLDCLSRAGEVERAEELLYYMLKQFRNGDKDATPDCFSFNCVIQGFTKSNLVRDGGRRAEMLLERMHEYHEEENSAVRPEARSYNLVLAYYSRSREPDAPYRAEYLLNQMVAHFRDGNLELCPSSFAFTSVIEKYAKVNHHDAGRNADRLLKLIRTLNSEHGASKLIVDTNLMNSVIFAWASCGDENAAEKAEMYLNEMESAYRNGSVALRPDTKTYWTVLSAWAKSSCPEKFRRALAILRRMELQQQEGNQDVCVDEHARSLVINACGFSNTYSDADVEAFYVACTIFDEILDADASKYPSSLTFAWFIQSCGRLRVPDPEKQSQIERAFRLCCKAGRVNEFVLHRLRGATSESFYLRLLGPVAGSQTTTHGQRSAIKHVPQSWKRNASATR